METDHSKLWTPGAILAALIAARFVYGWYVQLDHVWWIVIIDVGLLACFALLVNYHVRIMRFYKSVSEAATMRASRLESVTKELMEQESIIRDDLVLSHRELNERIVRLSGLLEATRELVTTRNLEDVLQRIVDMTRNVVSADKAMISANIGDETLTVVSSEMHDEDALLFRFASEIFACGEIVGELSVEFGSIDSGNVDTGNLLAIISAFASASIENAVLYRNLTEANEKLEVSRRYLERLVEEAPVGVVVIDDEYRVITWNQALAESIRVPSHLVEGTSLHETMTGPDGERFIELIEKAAEELDATVTDTIPLRLDNGEDCDFRVIISPIERLFGDSSGFIIMMEDVTEKVRLGEQLKQAERLKTLGEFAAGMAHEINNPIGIISACAEVMGKKLARHGPELEDCVKTARIIQDEAIRCSSIVKNLLGFARQGEMNPEEVNINDILNQTVQFIRGRAASAGVELIMESDDDLPLVIGDAHQLEQVFLNLSINAIEAMPDGGSLRITSGFDGDEARIAFCDTGLGIDRTTVQKLFNPFFTTKSSGTGLGLAVSLGIVERHGGRIDVGKSDSGGACFTVVLPLTNEAWEGCLSLDIEKHLHAGE